VGAYKAENIETVSGRGGTSRAMWDLSIAKPEAGLMLVGSVLVQGGGCGGRFG